MSFSLGLKKEAAGAIGELAGKAVNVAKGAKKAVTEPVKKAISANTKSFANTVKSKMGENLGNKAVDKAQKAHSFAMQPGIGQATKPGQLSSAASKDILGKVKEKTTASAQDKILARKPDAKKYLHGQKPSFASKHPYATAGLAAGATHLAFGGGGDKDQKNPPVVYGGGQSY